MGCSPWGLEESDTTERLLHFSLSCTGEGNGDSLQCSCLENPRDRGAWWAAVYGVSQSWTRLKRLGSSSSRPTESTAVSLEPEIDHEERETHRVLCPRLPAKERQVWDFALEPLHPESTLPFSSQPKNKNWKSRSADTEREKLCNLASIWNLKKLTL